jgi:hypothetical protein
MKKIGHFSPHPAYTLPDYYIEPSPTKTIHRPKLRRAIGSAPASYTSAHTSTTPSAVGTPSRSLFNGPGLGWPPTARRRFRCCVPRVR